MFYEARLRNGLKLLEGVYELTLSCIENNAYLIPEHVMEVMNRTTLPSVDKTSKYIVRHGGNVKERKRQNEIIGRKSIESEYQEYLMNTGPSFKKILANCLKINENNFDIEINNNKFRVVPKTEFDYFLTTYADQISDEITAMNNSFEIKKIIAIAKRNENLKSVANYDKPMQISNHITKEKFIV